MGSKTQELLETLDNLATLLESHGDQHWSKWIRDDASNIRAGDLYGVRHFLTAFGGMGSLNDRFLCKQNGDKITEEETPSVNARLSQGITKAWGLAQAILDSQREP